MIYLDKIQKNLSMLISVDNPMVSQSLEKLNCYMYLLEVYSINF